MLADVRAGDIGGDGPELAAEFGRGIRLEIVHVDVARPAAKPEKNDGRIARLPPIFLGPCFEAQMIGQGQSRQTEKADSQKAAPGKPVTATIIGSAYFEHWNPPKIFQSILAAF